MGKCSYKAVDHYCTKRVFGHDGFYMINLSCFIVNGFTP